MLKYHKIILLALIIVSFYLPAPFLPLFDLDEGAFSEATREMLLNHNYITTYLNGALRFDKPILIYWLQALSVKLFGLNEFALRLPSIIAATFWAMITYFFAKRYFNQKIAFLSTLFMVSSLQITIIAKAAIADSLLNFFLATTLFLLFEYTKTQKKQLLYLASAAAAFGVLTKGPVALFIPFMTLFFYLLSKKNLKLFFNIIFNPTALLLFFAIALPWYILEYLDQGQKFIDGFFLKHNISRFRTALEHHSGSIFYYIPVVIVGLMPFSFVFLKLLSQIKKYLNNDFFRYFLILFGFVFFFFSLSSTKLPHYVIYGYSGLFVMMAVVFEKMKSTFWLLLPAAFFYFLLFLLPFLAPYIHTHDQFANILLSNAPKEFALFYKLYFLFAILLTLWLLFNQQLDTIAKSIITAFVFVIGVNFVTARAYANLAQMPIKEAALIAKNKGLKVVMYKVNTPSFMVYSQHLVKKTKPKVGDIVFTKVTALKKFAKYKILYKKYAYALIKVEK